jgi:hypothetical protein
VNTHIVHGVENAPMNWFEPISGVRQGARNDHAHGVIQVSGAHLFVYVYLSDSPNIHKNLSMI